MANLEIPVLIKNAELTPKPEKKGVEIFICDPPWFDEQKNSRLQTRPRAQQGWTSMALT